MILAADRGFRELHRYVSVATIWLWAPSKYRVVYLSQTQTYVFKHSLFCKHFSSLVLIDKEIYFVTFDHLFLELSTILAYWTWKMPASKRKTITEATNSLPIDNGGSDGEVSSNLYISHMRLKSVGLWRTRRRIWMVRPISRNRLPWNQGTHQTTYPLFDHWPWRFERRQGTMKGKGLRVSF